MKQTSGDGTPEASTTWLYYDALGRKTAMVDGDNYLIVWTYDADGRIIGETQYANQITGSFSQTNTVSSLKTLAGTNANDASTSATYDALGRIQSSTDARGSVTTNVYDAIDELKSATQAMEVGAYDDITTSYTYDNFGEVVKTVDPRLNATYTYYDKLGRVIRQVDAERYVTDTSYTRGGKIHTVKRWAKVLASGVTVTETTYPPDPTTDALDATTTFDYDNDDRLTKTTDAELKFETYGLDAFGDRTTITNKSGGTSTYNFNKRGLVTSIVVTADVYNSAGTKTATSYTSHAYTYDLRGNVLTDTEAPGLSESRVTSYVYDDLNRVTEKHLPQVLDNTNSTLVTPIEYYKYDHRGNQIEAKDAASARTLSYYDQLDRVVVQIDPLGAYSTYTYSSVAGVNSMIARSYDTTVSLPANAGGTPPAAPSGTYRQTTSNYDKLGRLTSTVVAGVLTGQLAGSTYTTNANTTLTTSYSYDANGNVVTTTDPNGGVTYSYYDKLNRKTDQVDAGRFLTKWTLDAEGNALSETRYANQIPNAVAVATIASATDSTLTSLLGTGAADADRTTNFTYDRMGRRLTETRIGLTYWTIDANSPTGALTQVTNGSSTITYTYNALGEVSTRTEAATTTGSSAQDVTTYTYDNQGRLTRTAGASFADYSGATVQGILDYSYDGLGDVVRTVQNSTRITLYNYGAGGRLQSTTDPTGASSTHTYYYDIAGHKIGDAYYRLKSDGTTSLHEGISYQYDANGNLTRQAFSTVSGGTFTDAGDVTSLAYNAHGEVTSRSLNGVVQTQFRYDAAGRLEASNANGGVWSYYLYDANGNQTAEIDDEGAAGVNLVNQTLASVLAIATNSGASTVGGSYIDGVNATLITYDARNLALSSTQTKRQLTATGTPTDLTTSRAYNAFGEVTKDTDALNNATTYTYNTMGRKLSVVHPVAIVTGANGVDNTAATPTEYYYYDASGRLIGQKDANGNIVSRLLLAGTRAYRQTQADLIANGDFRGAQQMDINDINTKFGNKYDDAIQQMLRYSQSKGH
ncbi:MAG: hypothetical protein ACTHJR_17540 [Sphingomonas sp.]|uniref:hypothetical protein n=1 Tax=Sphingomonas sp. TaxID=28214 RepID=UPI003F7F3EEA